MSTTCDTTVTDIELGNVCSKIAYSWAEKTFQNASKNNGTPNPNLRGAFANVISFGSVNLAITSDGIGTKIEVAERMNRYDTLGFDLIAMIADDLICLGATPTTISNTLDVDRLDSDVVDALMRGLYNAAFETKMAVTGGEIAELGKRIGGYGDGMHFNWCATGLGRLDADQIIDGATIAEGDIVLTFKSPGFRSNGFSLARHILHHQYGESWHNVRADHTKSWGEVLLEPSLIYAPFINGLREDAIQIKGIVHVTGGGIAENLSRILKKRQLGACLDNLFAPNEAMRTLQSLGQLPEETVYQQWNMGNGMLLVVSEETADKILERARGTKYDIKKAGVITQNREIVVHSLGNEAQILRYDLC